MRWCALLPQPPESPGGEGFDAITKVRFDELNSGSVLLTQAVAIRGVRISKPNDVYTSGTGLRNPADVEALWESWVQARQRGVHLIIHWVPPCCSMSKAMQRSFLTRVRSTKRPWGLRNLTVKQKRTAKHGNDLALITEDLARKAHLLLGADITIENPDSSFIGQLGLFEWGPTAPGDSRRVCSRTT